MRPKDSLSCEELKMQVVWFVSPLLCLSSYLNSFVNYFLRPEHAGIVYVDDMGGDFNCQSVRILDVNQPGHQN
jgi:hypothetical protein